MSASPDRTTSASMALSAVARAEPRAELAHRDQTFLGYPYFAVALSLCGEVKAAGCNWLPRCRRTANYGRSCMPSRRHLDVGLTADSGPSLEPVIRRAVVRYDHFCPQSLSF